MAQAKHLVLDTSALFEPATYRPKAQHFHTIQSAIDEIKDAKRRETFDRERDLFGVNQEGIFVQRPSTEAINKVTQFARYTGDLAVLSLTDINILALTYDLEVSENGYARLRNDPKSPLPKVKDAEKSEADPQVAESRRTDESSSSATVEKQSVPHNQQSATESVESHDNNSLKENEQDHDDDDEDGDKDGDASESNEHLEKESDFEHDDDNEGDWITPDNIDEMSGFTPVTKNWKTNKDRKKSNKNKSSSSVGALEYMQVACVTRDFAMQNVALQINLNVIGPDGARIKQVKTWVLRCHSCFKIVKPSSSPTAIPPRFCPACGNTTLLRTSVTYVPISPKHPQGIIVHLAKNFQYRNRGTRYSLPNPSKSTSKGANPNPNMVLRPDQKEWTRATNRASRRLNREEERKAKGQESGMLDQDWLPDMLLSEKQKKKSGSFAKKQFGVGEILADLPPVGYGKKNPNEGGRRRR